MRRAIWRTTARSWVGEPALLLKIGQQVEHLRLHRDVERGNRLVAHDEGGLDRKSAGDADPLPLAARELVRVAPRVARVETHFLEQ
jgi:hypothetical protein